MLYIFVYNNLIFIIRYYIIYNRIQPINETKEKQLKLWKELILQYHMLNNIYILVIDNFEYFENKKINRKLSQNDINIIISYLISEGHAEWEDNSHIRCRIMWKTPETISNDIYTWVIKNGFINNIYTIFELLEGDEFKDSGFFGMDQGLFRKAILILQNNNKAILINGSTNDEDGIKFL